jgi:glucose/mannose-6-phosphate isomerase
MRELIGGMPKQFGHASAAFRKSGADLSGSYGSVAVVGMGGSAIGGDLAASYFLGNLPVPLHVVRDYRIPGFVSKDTLLIAVSYSGNTEETLSALKEAEGRGSRIVCIGSGGALQRLARSDSLPFFTVPSGMPPRCALAHMTASILLSVASAFGITGVYQDLEETGEVLSTLKRRLDPAAPAKDNAAKQLAAKCAQRLPVVYSSTRATDPVARRWSTQINENAKSLCHYNGLPELDHNEIVGWGLPRDVSYNSFVVFLDPGDLSDRLKKRLKVTKGLISDIAEVETVTALGSGRLARLFSLVYFGDYASFYLAMLNGVDPTPIERIDYLKKKIKEED